MMAEKPTYEELKKRVKVLEEEASEGQLAKKAILRTEERYRTLFDESRDVICITNRDGIFVDINQAGLELFGYTREEMIGKLDVRQIYVNPEERDRFREEIEKKTAVKNFPMKLKKQSGEVMECLITSSIHLSPDGKIFGYQGIIRDVTQYNQARKALQESEVRYRAMVGAFDGFIYICSRDYRIEYMNQRFIERTGHDGTGELCYKALHERDSICPWCVNDRVFQGETVRWEILSPKDEHWFYVVNTPIQHGDGRVSKQSMMLDITDRKEMEETVQKSSEKIKQFAYSVSHDLKSPAVGIYGLVKLLHRRYQDSLDEKGNACCDQILRAAEQIVSLVEQINMYISTKEMPLNVEKINPKEILQMTKEEFSAQLNVRQIGWSEPDSLPEICADRLCLLRILRNLVDNALKYGGEELTRIDIAYEETDQFHLFSVMDDGIGIQEGFSKRIWGVFQRFESSRGVQGTGLGLAIVKEIAERHGGKVQIESGGEKGVTIHVFLSKNLPGLKSG
jgi:PAS domain S-box-containing protein